MSKAYFNYLKILLFCFVLTALLPAETKPRTRHLGVPFDGGPGPLNAITDS